MTSRRATVQREATTTVLALLVAMAAGSVLILAFGESPARVYGTLLSETWGSGYGVGQVLFKATPLVFTGLAVALAFRAGLLNVGAEGQMVAGAFAAALVGSHLAPDTSTWLALPLVLVAAATAGGAVGATAGWLRARFGAHEVITTIMLNFIVGALALWAGRTALFLPETTHGAPVVAGAQLGALGLGGSAANTSVVIALAIAGAVWWLATRTRTGFEWGVLGHSAGAAEAAGVRVGRATVSVMAIAGAIAGLAASNLVLGDKHYFEEGLGRGAGFMGIAVALLARSHPLGVVVAALLFGTLSHGGFEVNALVPRELVEVLQAVIILALVAATAALRRAGPVATSPSAPAAPTSPSASAPTPEEVTP